MSKYIDIKDKSNRLHRWIVEEETDKTFKISYTKDRSIMTEIHKDKMIDDTSTSEIRNVKSNLGKIAYADFATIVID